MPTSRTDQPSKIAPIERERFKLTLEVVDDSRWDTQNLEIHLRNESTQDLSPKELPFLFQAWDLEGNPIGEDVLSGLVYDMKQIGHLPETLAPLTETVVEADFQSDFHIGRISSRESTGSWHLLVMGDQLPSGYSIYRLPVKK